MCIPPNRLVGLASESIIDDHVQMAGTIENDELGGVIYYKLSFVPAIPTYDK